MDRIELQLGKKYSVGRSSKCNIIVNDKHISSVHCIIWPAPHDPSDARHEVDTDLNKVLPCIEDCSSNGTWLYSARDRRKPKSHSSTKCTSAATKLEQGSKTILSTDDCFHLKSPKVFCDSSIGFTVKIDYGKHVALEPLQSSFTEYGSIEDVIKVEHPKEHVQDLDPNTSPLLTSDIEDLSIPSTKKPKVVKLTSDTNPLLGSQEEHCPTCLSVFALPELIDHAQVCCKQHYLQGKESISITEGVSSQSKDSKENEPRDLELCGYCLKEFPVVDLVQHASSCSSRSEHENVVMEQCRYCWMLFPLGDLFNHNGVCPAKKETNSQDISVQSSQDAGGEGVERCMYCFKDFPISKLIIHSTRCKGDMLGEQNSRFKEFLPSVHDLDAMALLVLSPTQRAAVEYVIKKSRMSSSAVLPELLHRVYSLGYTDDDIKKTFYWIKYEAPIIIHVNLDSVLHFLVEDTHYRNLFETGTGSGSTDFHARKSWEDRIFNGIYHNSLPHERVKYGVLNIGNRALSDAHCGQDYSLFHNATFSSLQYPKNFYSWL
jgi:hypothetical protein